MNDKLNQWLSQVDGKAIEAEDSSNYAQCFDLAFSWCDFLGIPRDSIRHLYAYQIFTNPNPDTSNYWDLIANTPTGVPLEGDLVIFGTAVGVAGHVCISKEGATTSSFRSEDQNWAGIQKAREISHSYNGVIGWLHPKVSSDSMQISKSDFENLVGKSTKYDAFVSAGFNSIDDVNNKIAELEQFGKDKDKEIAVRDTQIVELNKTVHSLQDENTQLKNKKPPTVPPSGPGDPKLEAVKKLVYSKWTFYPGKNYWVSRLHAIKLLFET